MHTSMHKNAYAKEENDILTFEKKRQAKLTPPAAKRVKKESFGPILREWDGISCLPWLMPGHDGMTHHDSPQRVPFNCL